jgi:hypothetical protein
MHAVVLLENLKGRDHLEGLHVDGKILLEWIFGKCCETLLARCIWLRIGISGAPLRT